MLLLRSLLYFLGSFITLIILVTVALSLFFLPFKFRYTILSKWSMFCLWWLEYTLNIKLQVIGKENIPFKPCVIVSNHQSTWETLGFQQIFPPQTWVLKKILLCIPFFGWGLMLLKPIVINRGKKLKALKKIIKQGENRLKNGIFVVIFPEGTRQPYKKLGKYQNGAIALAKKASCDIMPVYHNAGTIWPKGSFIKHAGTITVIIGKPMKVKEKSTKKLTQIIKNWTQKQSKKF
ncbi:lysophospholipid acyltransferase family protein [Candidatus Vesicomyidisocius sp. SY067_SCS001]|uniref:lysophospholipid acyltransferase family protein n=1 Tax=Candidatus Vesicomyidisocius sp. SY067_SCS001 TaxID=2732590 RepID=UPI001683B399|nr:lysophospholipid acyltransferase family protein [Candidatus Vesicomyosocius sp. SY067_SCS001]